MARNFSELRAKMDPTRRARVDARVKAAGTPGTSRAVKRFTLSEQNAEHVYDWLRMYWAGERERFGGCLECEEIGRRLERFIGPTAVRRVGRGIKVHKSIVRDQPGRAVAAPCAISGCHYSEAPSTVARMKKKHAK